MKLTRQHYYAGGAAISAIALLAWYRSTLPEDADTSSDYFMDADPFAFPDMGGASFGGAVPTGGGGLSYDAILDLIGGIDFPDFPDSSGGVESFVPANTTVDAFQTSGGVQSDGGNWHDKFNGDEVYAGTTQVDLTSGWGRALNILGNFNTFLGLAEKTVMFENTSYAANIARGLGTPAPSFWDIINPLDMLDPSDARSGSPYAELTEFRGAAVNRAGVTVDGRTAYTPEEAFRRANATMNADYFTRQVETVSRDPYGRSGTGIGYDRDSGEDFGRSRNTAPVSRDNPAPAPSRKPDRTPTRPTPSAPKPDRKPDYNSGGRDNDNDHGGFGGGSPGSGNDGSGNAGGGWGQSDIHTKSNIECVGRKNGFNVYEFEYTNKPGRYRGVMAQEVVSYCPEAVKSINGVLHVNYSLLGIDFQRVS